MENESLEARQVRLGKNQSLFRSVNERVEKISEQQATLGPVDFLCECATPNCGSRIELAHGEYEAIRRNPAHFFVLPDHVFPEVENIVDDRGRYVVVEKFGAAGRVASSIDARTATTS
jgi:hypothetical protein